MPPQSRGNRPGPSTQSSFVLPNPNSINVDQANAADDLPRIHREGKGRVDTFPNIEDDSPHDREGVSEKDHSYKELHRESLLAPPSEPISSSSSTSSFSDDDITPSLNSVNPYETDHYFPSAWSPTRLQKQHTLPAEHSSTASRPDFPRAHSLHAHPHSSASSSSLHIPNYPLTSGRLGHGLYTGPAAFAPPFYNRPPQPLPPSPSLTSLLRPSFTTSAAPSRPTTPGGSSSDTEPSHMQSHTASHSGTTPYPPANTPQNARPTHLRPLSGTAASSSSIPGSSTTSLGLHHAATTAPSHPPTLTPKTPTHEYYGFALYLSASALFLMYIIWSSLPTPFLHALGVWYYPERWWSLAVPAWIVVLLVWIYVALAGWNTEVLTQEVGNLTNLVDRAGYIAIVDGKGRIVRPVKNGGGQPQLGHGHGHGHSKGRSKAEAKNGEGSLRRKAKSPRVQQQQQRNKAGSRRTAADGSGPDEREGLKLPWRSLWCEGTDAVMDVPIGGVCEVLYAEGSSDEDE